MEEVDAIVVTHNSEAEVGDCLDSLRGRARVIVVDNASSDASVYEANQRPWAEVIVNPVNRGFAAAVNQAARLATGECLLILNPDAVLTTGLAPLVSDCRQYGIAAGCLTGPDGVPQRGFSVRSLPSPVTLVFECLGLNRLWPSNPVNRRYRCLDMNPEEPAMVEQPAGALLMVRRDVFLKLGGFDEDFWPVWFEDVDFSKRARDAGFLAAYNPAVRAKHSGAHSVGAISPAAQRRYWYGSLLKYAAKYYRPLTFRVICAAVLIGSLIRLSTGMLNRRSVHPFREYHEVLRSAALSMIAGKVVYFGRSDVRGGGDQPLGVSPGGR
jgi:N-acetylglucosaminyl-diphospho-decaprenol L-rhamnosyltransferase